MQTELYISDWCRKAGYTPENDYDPRYYEVGAGGELDEADIEILDSVNRSYGEDSYCIMCENVLYTNNANVMRMMQDDYGIAPMWFDIAGDDIGTVDELKKNCYVW